VFEFSAWTRNLRFDNVDDLWGTVFYIGDPDMVNGHVMRYVAYCLSVCLSVAAQRTQLGTPLAYSLAQRHSR
jgi:hypothetical protein